MSVLNHAFDQLDVRTLYQLLKLRVDVFVVEQTCPYPELDNKDILSSTRHLYLKDQGALVACARCLAPGVSFEQGAAIGRVAVDPESRGHGYAKVIMEEAIKTCLQQWPDKPILVSAQLYLAGFYQSLGFDAFGESYEEDGIPHLNMILQ
ncbi:GNAT family N-acetyltransferase [Endozoicomonas sp.]|uniref:GNAT family N-acetyltransferase n=1 Tax=Endozoicomonas sp. TaxID=1892382 RepID=UPI003AF88EB6